MRLHYAITKAEPTISDRFRVLLLRIILPKQIIVDFEDNFRKRVEKL